MAYSAEQLESLCEQTCERLLGCMQPHVKAFCQPEDLRTPTGMLYAQAAVGATHTHTHTHTEEPLHTHDETPMHQVCAETHRHRDMHMAEQGLQLELQQCQRMFTQRVCCTWQSAMPGQHLRVPEQAHGKLFPEKNSCDMQVPSWRHISCHTDKNRYYT